MRNKLSDWGRSLAALLLCAYGFILVGLSAIPLWLYQDVAALLEKLDRQKVKKGGR